MSLRGRSCPRARMRTGSAQPLVVPAKAAASDSYGADIFARLPVVRRRPARWLNFPDQFGGIGPGTVRFSRALPNHDARRAPTRNGSHRRGGVAASTAGNPCPLTISPSLSRRPPTAARPFHRQHDGDGVFVCGQRREWHHDHRRPDRQFVSGHGRVHVAPNTQSETQIRSDPRLQPRAHFFRAKRRHPSERRAGHDHPPRGLRLAVHRPATGPVHISPNEAVQLTNTEDPDAQWTSRHPAWLPPTPPAVRRRKRSC